MAGIKLPIKTPEWAGVPSEAVARFVNRLEENGLCTHAMILSRRGAIFAENYWKPFDQNFLHRMYSVSKTFVSAAVGIMIGEGKLSLSDKIADFFPEKLPAEVHPYIAAMTVRDLLMMATPHDGNAYTRYDEDWVGVFLQRKPTHRPGSVFLYDTAGTVALNGVVEKVSGQSLMDYLRPRLFDPIGISKEAWCIERPDGGAWGGSGVMCTARDLLKFAMVWMNGGVHEGVQLIPADYVCQATSKQIDNRTACDDPERKQGYGYQIWRITHNGFAMFGMGGQFAFCLPDHDFILILNSDTQGISTASSLILNAMWTELYPHLEAQASLPENPAAHAALEDQLAQLTLYHLKGATQSPATESVGGKRYVLDENPSGIRHVRFVFKGDTGTLIYENERGLKELQFGFGHNVEQLFPETYYGKRIGVYDRQFRCHSSAEWAGDNDLIIRTMVTDWYFGSLRIHVHFDGDVVTLMMTKTAEWFLDGYEGIISGHAG